MLYESKIEPTKPCIWSISCYINNLDRSIYTGFGAVPDFERIMALVSLAYLSIGWPTRHGIITETVNNFLGRIYNDEEVNLLPTYGQLP